MGLSGLFRVLFASGSILQLASAHFRLLNPPTIGLNDDSQGQAPCGGYFPDFTAVNLSNFHTNGEPVAVSLGHSQANWLFRAFRILDGDFNNTDPDSQMWEPENWKQLYPVVRQTGAENFCIPSVSAPDDWSGQKGVLGVVSDGPDGLMYQCIAVNFVSGISPGSPDCHNGTYSNVVEGEYVHDTELEALVNAALPVPSNAPVFPSSTSTSTTTTATPSPTRDLSGDRWGDSSTAHGMSHSAQVAVAVCMSFAAVFFIGIIVLLWRRRVREKTTDPVQSRRSRGRRCVAGDDGLTRPLAMRQLSRRSEDGVADPPPPYEYNATPPSTANPGPTNAPPGPAPPVYTRDSQISQRPISTASPI